MAITTEQRSTAVGEDRRQADAAINELRQAGFRKDQIGVATHQAEGETSGATTAEEGSCAGAAWEILRAVKGFSR